MTSAERSSSSRRSVTSSRFPIGVAQTASGTVLPGGDPGDVRLEMPAPRACPLTGKAVVHDHDVAELGPATEELTVDDRAAPATRPEGEHDHRVDVARGTETELGVGRRVRVVLD